MSFRDRKEAGERLGEALAKYSGKDTIVYALPRGGVVVGFEVAHILGASLDLVITRKIGHPGNPEYAVCAITEGGDLICNEEERGRIDPLWLERAAASQQQEAKRRRFAYLGNRPRIPAAGKTVILIDDGIATGLSMEAAIQTIEKDTPRKIIIAAPVSPRPVASAWRRKGYTVLILDESEPFLGAVGNYYDVFPQVSDSEVVQLLFAASSPVGEKKR